jgi:hypothetical protein
MKRQPLSVGDISNAVRWITVVALSAREAAHDGAVLPATVGQLGGATQQ